MIASILLVALLFFTFPLQKRMVVGFNYLQFACLLNFFYFVINFIAGDNLKFPRDYLIYVGILYFFLYFQRFGEFYKSEKFCIVLLYIYGIATNIFLMASICYDYSPLGGTIKYMRRHFFLSFLCVIILSHSYIWLKGFKFNFKLTRLIILFIVYTFYFQIFGTFGPFDIVAVVFFFFLLKFIAIDKGRYLDD